MQTKRIFVLVHIRNKDDGSNRQTCLSTPVFLLTVLRLCFFCGSFLLFVFHVCHVSSLQPCGHLLGRAVLLVLLYMKFFVFLVF